MKVFSAPTSYLLRRILVSGDPFYWDKKSNVLREARQHPQWNDDDYWKTVKV